jgi:hypothetical protein
MGGRPTLTSSDANVNYLKEQHMSGLWCTVSSPTSILPPHQLIFEKSSTHALMQAIKYIARRFQNFLDLSRKDAA